MTASFDQTTVVLVKLVTEGVYPQSDGGLAIVDIDASKWFIALWVHLFVAIGGLHRNGYRRKRYFFVATKFKHV